MVDAQKAASSSYINVVYGPWQKLKLDPQILVTLHFPEEALLARYRRSGN